MGLKFYVADLFGIFQCTNVKSNEEKKTHKCLLLLLSLFFSERLSLPRLAVNHIEQPEHKLQSLMAFIF